MSESCRPSTGDVAWELQRASGQNTRNCFFFGLVRGCAAVLVRVVRHVGEENR